MSLTYGPQTFDVVPRTAADVKVFNWADGSAASLSSAVQVDSKGAVTFTVSAAGTYSVVISTPNAGIRTRVSLSDTAPYDITDPRSYAKSLGGGTSTGGIVVLEAGQTIANVPAATPAGTLIVRKLQ